MKLDYELHPSFPFPHCILVSKRYQYTKELENIFLWLQENYDPFTEYEHWYSMDCIVVSFDSEDKAMHMKLVWGGDDTNH